MHSSIPHEPVLDRLWSERSHGSWVSPWRLYWPYGHHKTHKAGHMRGIYSRIFTGWHMAYHTVLCLGPLQLLSLQSAVFAALPAGRSPNCPPLEHRMRSTTHYPSWPAARCSPGVWLPCIGSVSSFRWGNDVGNPWITIKLLKWIGFPVFTGYFILGEGGYPCGPSAPRRGKGAEPLDGWRLAADGRSPGRWRSNTSLSLQSLGGQGCSLLHACTLWSCRSTTVCRPWGTWRIGLHTFVIIMCLLKRHI